MLKFNYRWNLAIDYPKQKHNLKVFTTFACGGGSSMGYKLAGFNVIGASDIDQQIAKVYKANHNPKHYFLESISKFNQQKNLHPDLFSLDILDGSPPCSAFSISGTREKTWGKKKKFREGQAEQILDNLFFEFIETIDKLKPKVFIAENVKGMLVGNAKGYLVEIIKQIKAIGYKPQIFLLNSASMGVPQKRERVFIIGNRVDYPKLRLEFKETKISFKNIDSGLLDNYKNLGLKTRKLWTLCKPGEYLSSVDPNGGFYTHSKVSKNNVVSTIISGSAKYHYKQPRILDKNELCLAGSFPLDYNFLNINPQYLIGMSVPPVMMAQVSNQVYKQWLSLD